MSDTYTNTKLIQRGLHDQIISQEGVLTGDEFLLRHLRPGLKVLDVGCGPGTIAFQVHPHLRPTGHLIGVDVSHETLQRAFSSATSQRIVNIDFIRGTAYDLPFFDSHFDVVYCRHLLMHLEDVTKATRELIRVTRHGGHLIAIEGDIETWNYYPRFPEWEELFHIVRQKLGTSTVGRQLWAIFNSLELANVQITGITNIATGDDFKNHLIKWLEAFQFSRDYLIETNVCNKDMLENALSKGYELLHHPFGFYSSIEYEVRGRKI